jgi:hypothetical protein
MNRYLGNQYRQHAIGSQALFREMLAIINRQEQHLAWIDRMRYQMSMSVQRNRNQRSNVVSPVINPRPRVYQSSDSRPTIADILTAAIMTELGPALSPVVVRPTSQVIAQATETIPFTDIESPQYQTCPISHEEFNNSSAVTRIRHCAHYFDPEAIGHWLSTSVRCPVCRHDIRDGVNSPNAYDGVAVGSAHMHNTEVSDIPDDFNENENNAHEQFVSNSSPDNFEYTSYINPHDPNSIANFMETISRDMNNSSNNMSFQFEFVPQFMQPFDMSNNISNASIN